jgi:gliding motility associated protien GldN
MKKFAKLSALLLILVGSVQHVNAQATTPQDDGIILDPPRHHHNARVVEYPYLRESDLMWKTRHWEQIDIREKINHPLFYPIVPIPDRKPLFNVLVDAILVEGTITEVFDDDRFQFPLTDAEIRNRIERIDTLLNPDDPTLIDLIDTLKIKAPSVVAYHIKSDWYFDKQRGEMKNRIIGISPVVTDPKIKSETYNLCWIWFPDARYALATHVAYNEHNNMQRLSFDEIFHLRKFSSVIIKEDNVFDRAVKDYKRNNAMDQLLEAQRIKENLRNFEHDLWEF